VGQSTPPKFLVDGEKVQNHEMFVDVKKGTEKLIKLPKYEELDTHFQNYVSFT
jgi:hypothetical protein